MMRSANPSLTQGTFSSMRQYASAGNVMTIGGTVVKTLILLLCVLVTAGFTWNLYFQTGNAQSVTPWLFLGVFGGLISAVVTIYKKEWAGITAPIYALFQGLFIGGISSIFEAQYPGLVFQAVSLTFGTLAVMLFAYESGLIKATEKFKLGVVAATGAVALVYFVSIIFSFFGVNFGFIYGSGIAGIGFSLIVVGIAALNLILDFDVIEKGAAAGAPKFMEWYGAFALMVTLIWLYIEMLRLLSKLRSSR
ncbi:MAG: hypothetical protein K940chlam3_01547 [Chlamydiae bacterium]|nr:hypothetical protein [Chlamydiota bacterium]